MSKARSLELFARWPHSYLLNGTFTHLIPGYLVQVPATTQPQNGSTFSHWWSLTHCSRFLPRDTFPTAIPSFFSTHWFLQSPPLPRSISDSTLIMNTLQGFFRSLLSYHENMEMPIDSWEKVCLLISCVKESSPQLCLSEAPCFGI